MKNYQIKDEDIGKRLDIVMAEALNVTRSQVKTMLEAGAIVVPNAKKAGHVLRKSDEVLFDADYKKPEISAAPEKIDINIIYEDEHLMVINKPQGMVVHPAVGNSSGTLVNALLHHSQNLSSINGDFRPGIVHRLDKNTSGLMLVAKNDAAHLSLQKQIGEKTCLRKYLALVHGGFKESEGVIETYFGRNPKERKKMAVLNSGKKAITHFRVEKAFEKFTLVEFLLKTGRTHQIRVHAKHINHPVVGDDVYGKADKNLKGQLLHSFFLEFSHPKTEKRMNFSAPLPKYFEEYIKKLKEKH